MFEEYTEINILKSMMDKIPGDLDKREGSIIYNALAPAACELARLYSNMDYFLQCAFVNTEMPNEYLDLKAKEYGLSRKSAIKCVKKGMFYDQNNILVDIPIGSRFSIEGYNFVAIEKISTGTFKMQCETPGTGSNSIVGPIIPVEYIEGLSVATLTDTFVYGEEVESNESLINRLYLKVQAPATSGNVYHYKIWTLEVTGVGDCRIVPLWNGPGTVKIVAIDNNKRKPNQEVINKIVTNVEEKRPIGATVTIAGATEININIAVNITVDNTDTMENIKTNISKNIGEYIKSIAFKENIIRYTRIANCILDVKGVVDYNNLTVNNGTTNVTVTDEQVPVLGNVVITNA